MPDAEANLRKMTFLACHGEWSRAWKCCSPSPAIDPRLTSSKVALIDFNAQQPYRKLTDADVADEPGATPIHFSTAVVLKAAKATKDIRASGDLPEDNRVMKCLIRHGGLGPITKWINETARDRAHPTVRDMLAGACRSCLIAKCHPLSGKIVGKRPIGIAGQFRNLTFACMNISEKAAIRNYLEKPMPEDVSARASKVAKAEAAVVAAIAEQDALVRRRGLLRGDLIAACVVLPRVHTRRK